MHLEEYKKALLQTLVHFIKEAYPVSYPVLYDKDSPTKNMMVLFQKPSQALACYFFDMLDGVSVLSEHNSIQQMTSAFPSVDIRQVPGNAVSSIHYFIESILAEELSGYNLWQSVQKELDTMPGWWHFFSNSRNLRLDLKEVQKEYAPQDLKAQDDEVIETIINELHEQIAALMKQFQNMKKLYDDLLAKHRVLENNYQETFKQFSKEQDVQEAKITYLKQQRIQLKKCLQDLTQKHSKVADCAENARQEVTRLERENRQLITRMEYILNHTKPHSFNNAFTENAEDTAFVNKRQDSRWGNREWNNYHAKLRHKGFIESNTDRHDEFKSRTLPADFSVRH